MERNTVTKRLDESWNTFSNKIPGGPSSWFLIYDGQLHKIDNIEDIENGYNKYKGIKMNTIDKIEKIRAENNKNWMNLLRLALKHAPEEAKEIFNKITECDLEINKLMKELGNE